MTEFEKSVNAFLEFRQYKILRDNGRISHKQALKKAYKEYEIFNKTQPIESDFDKAVKDMIWVKKMKKHFKLGLSNKLCITCRIFDRPILV